MVHGSWLMAQGSWLTAQGSWPRLRRTGQERGVQGLGPGPWEPWIMSHEPLATDDRLSNYYWVMFFWKPSVWFLPSPLAFLTRKDIVFCLYINNKKPKTWTSKKRAPEMKETSVTIPCSVSLRNAKVRRYDSHILRISNQRIWRQWAPKKTAWRQWDKQELPVYPAWSPRAGVVKFA